MANDDFTKSAELSLSTAEYQSQNDNVAQFVNNVCSFVENSDEKIDINSLYKVYNIWAESQSLRGVSKKVFIQRIVDLGYNKSKGYINGKSGQTYFNGLLLNTNSEDYQEIAFEVSIAFAAR